MSYKSISARFVESPQKLKIDEKKIEFLNRSPLTKLLSLKENTLISKKFKETLNKINTKLFILKKDSYNINSKEKIKNLLNTQKNLNEISKQMYKNNIFKPTFITKSGYIEKNLMKKQIDLINLPINQINSLNKHSEKTLINQKLIENTKNTINLKKNTKIIKNIKNSQRNNIFVEKNNKNVKSNNYEQLKSFNFNNKINLIDQVIKNNYNNYFNNKKNNRRNFSNFEYKFPLTYRKSSENIAFYEKNQEKLLKKYNYRIKSEDDKEEILKKEINFTKLEDKKNKILEKFTSNNEILLYNTTPIEKNNEIDNTNNFFIRTNSMFEIFHKRGFIQNTNKNQEKIKNKHLRSFKNTLQSQNNKGNTRVQSAKNLEKNKETLKEVSITIKEWEKSKTNNEIEIIDN